jgi:haloalkane dehalogenase
VKFVTPAIEELSYLRADPLLQEQELDVRPDIAEAIERAAGLRAGQVYWRSEHDYLYSLELLDAGRGRPAMATVYGHWDRYEPRPPEHEIDRDLLAFSVWVAEAADSLNPADVLKVARFAGVKTGWPDGAVLRTPEERFAALPDFPYSAKYVGVEGLRIAYVEQGAGDPILLLHGEPTWSYLYRHMIPPLAGQGRAIAPDLIGFGRSDKPAAANAHTYKSHARRLRGFIEALDLNRITLVCHDWGGLLGLRVLSQIPERFAGVVAMNTDIPGGAEPSEAFLKWRRYSQRVPSLDVAQLLRGAIGKRELTDAEAAAYVAPFPSVEYQTAALVFPRLVPIRRDDPGAFDNRVAIERLKKLDLPVLLLWSGGDPITAPGEAHLRSIFRNAAPTIVIEGAGHFLPEEAGEELTEHILQWRNQRHD